MLKTSLIAAALVVAGMAVVPQSFAQTKGNSGIQMSRSATITKLKAETGQTRLKCTGGAGHMTCTSKLAWVCPKGWNACTPPPGGTCCTQN